MSLTHASRPAVTELAKALGLPVALLSRDGDGWRFETDAVPVQSDRASAPHTELPAAGWSGIPLGTAAGREWLAIVPGHADAWTGRPGLDRLIDRTRRILESSPLEHQPAACANFARRLYAFTRRLTQHANAADLHAVILAAFAREVSATTGSFALFDEGQRTLTITTTRGYPLPLVEHLRIPPGEGIIGEAFLTRRAAIGTASHQARRYRYRTDSFVVVPLTLGDRAIAVSALTDRADGMAFTDDDLSRLRMLAAPAALALARVRTDDDIRELTRAATVDPVTGLFNRRHFESSLHAEISRATRQQQDLALLMIDIDRFKSVNDTRGHVEGDVALRTIAELLRTNVRVFDVCARIGGDEFAIIMPGATTAVGMQVAERIRREVETRTSGEPRITVSIGLAGAGAGTTVEEFTNAADRALLAAKKGGRNRVCIATS